MSGTNQTDKPGNTVPSGGLNLKPLREQVYDHLRMQLNHGVLAPGATLDLNALSAQLGVSKTPLRDALIQLESEGFVTILPRRGVMVPRLTLEDIRNLYQIIGALEGEVLSCVAKTMSPDVLEKMAALNETMAAAFKADRFDVYYAHNLTFHDAYLQRTSNQELLRIVHRLKQRLHDFPRRRINIPQWETQALEEHRAIVACLRRGDIQGAVHFLRDAHWSFEVQEPFIRQYYFDGRDPDLT